MSGLTTCTAAGIVEGNGRSQKIDLLPSDCSLIAIRLFALQASGQPGGWLPTDPAVLCSANFQMAMSEQSNGNRSRFWIGPRFQRFQLRYMSWGPTSTASYSSSPSFLRMIRSPRFVLMMKWSATPDSRRNRRLFESGCFTKSFSDRVAFSCDRPDSVFSVFTNRGESETDGMSRCQNRFQMAFELFRIVE